MGSLAFEILSAGASLDLALLALLASVVVICGAAGAGGGQRE
ncbi:MAG: hypothetical protein WKF37_19825 [Bryobacteraceae bacterium]